MKKTIKLWALIDEHDGEICWAGQDRPMKWRSTGWNDPSVNNWCCEGGDLGSFEKSVKCRRVTATIDPPTV